MTWPSYLYAMPPPPSPPPPAQGPFDYQLDMDPGTYPFGYPQMLSASQYPPFMYGDGPHNYIPRKMANAYPPMPSAHHHPPHMTSYGPQNFNILRKVDAAKVSPPSADTSFRGLGATPPTPLQDRQTRKQKGNWGPSMPSPGPQNAKAYCPSPDLEVEACWWPSGLQSYAANQTRAEKKENGGGNKMSYDQGWGANTGEALEGKKSFDHDSRAITPALDLGLLYRNAFPRDAGTKQYEGTAWGVSNESKGPDGGYRKDCVSPALSGYRGRHHCDGWDGCVDVGKCTDCGLCVNAYDCVVESKSEDDSWGAEKKTRKSNKSQNAGWGTDGATSTINEDCGVESNEGWGSHKCKPDDGVSCSKPCWSCGICPKKCGCNGNSKSICSGWGAGSLVSSTGGRVEDEAHRHADKLSSWSEASSGAGGGWDAGTDLDDNSTVQANGWDAAPPSHENDNNRITYLENRVSALELNSGDNAPQTHSSTTISHLEALRQAILDLSPSHPSFQQMCTSFIGTVEGLENSGSQLSPSLYSTVETMRIQRPIFNFNDFREEEDYGLPGHETAKKRAQSNTLRGENTKTKAWGAPPAAKPAPSRGGLDASKRVNPNSFHSESDDSEDWDAAPAAKRALLRQGLDASKRFNFNDFREEGNWGVEMGKRLHRGRMEQKAQKVQSNKACGNCGLDLHSTEDCPAKSVRDDGGW